MVSAKHFAKGIGWLYCWTHNTLYRIKYGIIFFFRSDGIAKRKINIERYCLITMKLSELKTGESGIIVKVQGHGGFRKRIIEMGFVKGKQVKVLLNAPLQV